MHEKLCICFKFSTTRKWREPSIVKQPHNPHNHGLNHLAMSSVASPGRKLERRGWNLFKTSGTRAKDSQPHGVGSMGRKHIKIPLNSHRENMMPLYSVEQFISLKLISFNFAFIPPWRVMTSIRTATRRQQRQRWRLIRCRLWGKNAIPCLFHATSDELFP